MPQERMNRSLAYLALELACNTLEFGVSSFSLARHFSKPERELAKRQLADSIKLLEGKED